MIRFASPAWLSLFALEAKADPDLADGVHLRLLPSPKLGLPIAPWVVWQVQVHTIERRLAGAKPRGLLTIPIEPPPGAGDGTRYVAVEAVTAGRPRKMSISLLDPQDGRVLTRRSKAPYIVGGPVVRRVRLEGDISFVQALRIYVIDAKSIDRLLHGEAPITELGLPISGPCRWHYGGAGRDGGMERVRRGAPRRLTPLDRPDGPLDPLSPDDEEARITALRDDVDDALEAVVRQPDAPPWDVVRMETQPPSGAQPAQYAEIPELDGVLLAACDPGFARYLGFADEVAERVRPEIAKPMAGLVASGLFAVDPDRVVFELQVGPFTLKRTLGQELPPIDAEEEAMIKRVLKATGAHGVAERLQEKGFQIRCFTAPAGAVPPPDAPGAPLVSLAEADWIAPPSGVATSFRQGFRLTTAAFAPLLAMARREGGAYAPRTRPVDTKTGERRIPLFTGRDAEDQGVASDAPVPAGPPVPYRFHVGDLFGRFGPPRDIDVPEPDRPPPPTPAPQAFVLRATLDDQAPGALSPGLLDVRVPVPGNDSIGLGGRPLDRLVLSFAGETRVLDVTPGEPLAATFTLPALQPQQAGVWTLSAQFIDDHGRLSAEAWQEVAVTDGRRPRPVPAGPGIIWTSRPGPSPDVELRLAWPGAPGQAYRAWIADQRSLGLNGAGPRAAVALDGFMRQQRGELNGLGDRFRLLTAIPVQTGADGWARLDTTLPRALQTVSFLRIVPATDEGVEADFDACAVVPVAVPDDRRPPTPRLILSTDPAGHPSLEIEAVGLDIPALAAAEPGLFAEPPTAARAPEYRLRRASGPVVDPLYARVLKSGALGLDRSTGAPRFLTEAADASGLLPFVRYTWWAEIRLPPERRLPQDAAAVPPPGAITAQNAAQTADAPAPYSLLSAPVSLVHAPPGAPAALAATALAVALETDGAGQRIRLNATDLPVAHPQAVRPYRLRVWIQRDGGAPELAADDLPVSAAALSWVSPASPPTNAATVFVSLIDPLGRESPPTSVDVASP